MIVSSTVTVIVDKTNGFDVFISYSWEQKEIVRRIAKRLKKENFKIWLDVEQIVCTYQFGLMHGTAHIIRPVSKQGLFIHDLPFIEHFTVSGDMRRC